MLPVPDPAFEFVRRFTAWVLLIWPSLCNVELMLANDTSFIKRLPGDNASTRSVSCEGSAGTAPSPETDVLPETSNMLMTAVLDTSVSKRVWVISTDPVRKYAVAGSPASPDQPQIQTFRTTLLKVDVLTGLLLDAFLSLTAEATLSGLPSSCQDRLASSELSCPVLSKILRVSA